jgi:hypothetical protein
MKMEDKMANRINHQEVVKKLLDSKAVDFAALGKMVAEIGPTISLADEPWDGFCGTMRNFVHIMVIHRPGDEGGVDNLGSLSGVSGEVRG